MGNEAAQLGEQGSVCPFCKSDPEALADAHEQGWRAGREHERIAAQVVAIDAAHLARQREWSERTFGPGTRLLGVLDHIRKELEEVEADPTDVEEWVDVIILAFDGAWRAGWEPQQIIDAIKAKQAKNEARTWPDWRQFGQDQAIEHIEPDTCPDCRHAVHGEWCPNLASDNDCACTTVTRCRDKACSATTSEGCKYPRWTLCGFPGRSTSPANTGADQ